MGNKKDNGAHVPLNETNHLPEAKHHRKSLRAFRVGARVGAIQSHPNGNQTTHSKLNQFKRLDTCMTQLDIWFRIHYTLTVALRELAIMDVDNLASSGNRLLVGSKGQPKRKPTINPSWGCPIFETHP